MNSIALVLTLFLALFLRLFRLSENPVSLNQDEAVNGYDAYSLLMTMRDHHGNFLPIMLESFGDWASAIVTYLTIPFVKIFGLSEFAIRLPIALLGVATVGLIYVFTVQLFDRKRLGLLAAFLLAIMPWHITISRWAIPPSIVPFFLLLLVVTFLWAVERGRNSALILVAVWAAVLTYSYPTQKVFVPLFLAAISAIYLRKRSTQAIVWIPYIALIAPMYILTLSDPGKYNARFSQVSIVSSDSNLFEIAAKFLIRYIRYLSPDFNFGSTTYDVMHHVPGFGSTYEFLAVFFYIGVLTCIHSVLKPENSYKLSQKSSLLLLSWLLIAPIPASLTKDYNHVLRMVHMLPVIIPLVILGLVTIAQALSHSQLKKSLILTVLFLGLLNTASFTHFYIRKYPEVSKESYQYGIKEFMNYAIENEDKFTKIIVDSKINQPYIYYLFYSKYNPKLINPADIEPSRKVKKISKYEFREISDRDLINSQEIYKVQDTNRIWYRVYSNSDRVLFIQREQGGSQVNL
ncbi:glycosyltransferase family 39 protein [Phormidesmis priestleyi]